MEKGRREKMKEMKLIFTECSVYATSCVPSGCYISFAMTIGGCFLFTKRERDSKRITYSPSI